MKRSPVIFEGNFFVLLSLLLLLAGAMFFWGSQNSLDTRIYYTGEQARDLLQNMGSIERQSYWINELIDFFFFIPTYTAVLFLGLKQVYTNDKKMWLLAITPTAFDLLETVLILYALNTFVPQAFFNWLGLITFFKWLLALGAILALVRGTARQWRNI